MATKLMQTLLCRMNKEAVYHEGCEPSFAVIANEDGDDTDVDFGNENDIFIHELLSESKSFKPSNLNVLLCDMPLGRCHLNVIEALEDGDTIYTGYAQIAYPDGSGGDWFPHSWLINSQGDIVETFDQYFPCYFGFPLNNETKNAFYSFVESL